MKDTTTQHTAKQN